MGIRTAWKILVTLGVLVLWRSLAMDTSVEVSGLGTSRVHNLSLASQQLALLLVGATLFLGGIILLGVAKLKQTREEEARDLSIREAQALKVRDATAAIVAKVPTNIEAGVAHVRAIAASARVKSIVWSVLSVALGVLALFLVGIGGWVLLSADSAVVASVTAMIFFAPAALCVAAARIARKWALWFARPSVAAPD